MNPNRHWPSGRRSRALAIALGVVALAACQTFMPPPQPRPAPHPQPAPTQPSHPAPAPHTETPQPAPAPTKKFRLSAASSSLVTQARGQTATGDSAAAAATLERALRIEPSNPLLWIELGHLRMSEHNPAQADSMGRKALALATGDPSAQAAAWRLIAESLRARGRNSEAVEAEQRANTLLAPFADELLPPATFDEELNV